MSVTIRVDGIAVTIYADTNIDDLTDAEYAALEDHCNAEKHKLGACPLCSDIDVRTDGAKSGDRDYVSSLWGDWSQGWGEAKSTGPKTYDAVKQQDRFTLAKLVQAHKIVRSFVSTFATGGTSFDVTFDESIGTAGTDLKGKKVVISPAPALDPTLTPEQAGTILTAMAVHESAHVRYDTRTSAAVFKAFAGQPTLPTAQKLGNLLADVRIEQRFSVEYPGYAHVFAPALAYVAQVDSKGAFKASLDDPFTLAVAAVRYAPWADFTGVETERDWWQAWSAKWTVRDEPRFTVEGVKEAIAHIGVIEDMTSSGAEQTPGGSSPRESQSGESGQGTGNDSGTPTSVPVKPSDGQGASGTGRDLPECVTEGIIAAAIANGVRPNEIDGETAQRRVNAAETTVNVTIPTGNGDHTARGDVQPCSNLSSRNRIHAEPQPLVTATVREALLRSRSGRTGVERTQPRGRLDNRSITRVAFSDDKVFHRRTALSPGKYLFWLLVDRSSSMNGEPTQQVVSATKAIAQAAAYVPNLRLEVFGWTTANAGDAVQYGGASWGAYRAWGTGENIDKIGDLGRIHEGGTPDGYVLKWAVDAIQKRTARDEHPVIVILSDGMGMSTAMKDIVADARRKGVSVMSVAIGYVSEEVQQSIYGDGNYVTWKREDYKYDRDQGRYVSVSGGIVEAARDMSRAIGRIVAVK